MSCVFVLADFPALLTLMERGLIVSLFLARISPARLMSESRN